MNGFVDERGERLDRIPHGHVDDKEWIATDIDVGGVATFALQPPDEAGALIGQRVDPVEPAHEAVQARVVGWVQDSADVYLRDLP